MTDRWGLLCKKICIHNPLILSRDHVIPNILLHGIAFGLEHHSMGAPNTGGRADWSLVQVRQYSSAIKRRGDDGGERKIA